MVENTKKLGAQDTATLQLLEENIRNEFEDSDVKILMTLTTPNCPVAETLPMEVEEKVKSLDEVKTAEVEITFDPPWTQDLMSEEAKLELGML